MNYLFLKTDFIAPTKIAKKWTELDSSNFACVMMFYEDLNIKLGIISLND